MRLLVKTLLISTLSFSSPIIYPHSSNDQKCGWTRLGLASDNSYEHYIDYCRISGTGRFLTGLTLHDYKVQQRGANSSSTIESVFDCYLRRRADTKIYRYQGNMAQGAVVYAYSVPESKWSFRAEPPNSVGATKLEAVCK